MPTDIKLNILTHDIDLSNGTLEVFSDNIEVTAQRVKVAILKKMGEWFMDLGSGVPYYQEFYRIKNNKKYIDSFMIDYISKVQDVQRVDYYNSSLNNRALEIEVSFTTDAGEITTINVEV